jgi:hypothetical protein
MEVVCRFNTVFLYVIYYFNLCNKKNASATEATSDPNGQRSKISQIHFRDPT